MIPGKTARVALRVALGATFLSAVASRVGLWGGHAGRPGEAFASFLGYVGELNPWAPAPLLMPLACGVTVLEATLGLGLVAGIRPRAVALASGALLTVFAVAMSVFTGPKSAFDYSVWSAAAGAFLLASSNDGPA